MGQVWEAFLGRFKLCTPQEPKEIFVSTYCGTSFFHKSRIAEAFIVSKNALQTKSLNVSQRIHPNKKFKTPRRMEKRMSILVLGWCLHTNLRINSSAKYFSAWTESSLVEEQYIREEAQKSSCMEAKIVSLGEIARLLLPLNDVMELGTWNHWMLL